MTGPAFTFRRLGTGRPPAYAVESPSDYLGNVVAVDPGRPGQSRSVNSYLAYPVTRRGYAADRPLGEVVQASPFAGMPGRKRFVATVYGSRREAAEAIQTYLAEQGRC